MNPRLITTIDDGDYSIRFVSFRPADAHPALPVHLERVYYYRAPDGSMLPTGRRDWIGSWPTHELAAGRAMMMAGM